MEEESDHSEYIAPDSFTAIVPCNRDICGTGHKSNNVTQ